MNLFIQNCCITYGQSAVRTISTTLVMHCPWWRGAYDKSSKVISDSFIVLTAYTIQSFFVLQNLILQEVQTSQIVVLNSFVPLHHL